MFCSVLLLWREGIKAAGEVKGCSPADLKIRRLSLMIFRWAQSNHSIAESMFSQQAAKFRMVLPLSSQRFGPAQLLAGQLYMFPPGPELPVNTRYKTK